MPPKKQAQLQISVETQEEWNEMVSKEGLAVMDVYSAWCGPCKAVQGLFRRVKNEIGDHLLRFGLAKSDTIDSLEPYRNKSKPTFLMFSKGVLVAVVRGALGPLLEKTIKEQLAYEHQVLEEGKPRIPIVDEVLGLPEVVLEEDAEETGEEEKRPEPRKKQYTVMVIKPDAVQAGKVDEIIEKVKSQGMEILASEEHQFTQEEAAEFYQQHEGSDHFEELIEFMCSGPCWTLVLTKGDTGEGVVEEIRDLIGPKDVDEAKEVAPESIRATFGTDTRMNAVHASDSHEVAARELAFFLPKLKIPYVPGTEPPIERTLALIRPDALAKHRDAILAKISEAGFEVAFQKELTLTKEQAEEFYKEHEGKDFFDSLTTHMSSGPMLALCLAREDAIAEWRRMLTGVQPEEKEEGEGEEGKTEGEEGKTEGEEGEKGSEEGEKEGEEGKKEGEDGEEGQKLLKPPNLRVEFAVEGEENPLHGSISRESAATEVNFFFPMEHTFCTIKPSHFSEREAIVDKIKESGFQVSMAEESTLTREMAEQLYSKQKDKDYFEDLVSMMSSGPSMFMVLSKPDAVMGWRAVMGATDPEEAREQDPNCLRALFGKTALENAVHGSSDKDSALEEIEQAFGPVEFMPDGSVIKTPPPSEQDPEQEEMAPSEQTETTPPDQEGTKEETTPPEQEETAPTKQEEITPPVEGDTQDTPGDTKDTFVVEGDTKDTPVAESDTQDMPEGDTKDTLVAESDMLVAEGYTPQDTQDTPIAEGDTQDMPAAEGDTQDTPAADTQDTPDTQDMHVAEGDTQDMPAADTQDTPDTQDMHVVEGDTQDTPVVEGDTPQDTQDMLIAEGDTPQDIAKSDTPIAGDENIAADMPEDIIERDGTQDTLIAAQEDPEPEYTPDPVDDHDTPDAVVDDIPSPVVPDPVVDDIPDPVVNDIPDPVVPDPVVDDIPDPVVPDPVVYDIPDPVVNDIPDPVVDDIPDPDIPDPEGDTVLLQDDVVEEDTFHDALDFEADGDAPQGTS